MSSETREAGPSVPTAGHTGAEGNAPGTTGATEKAEAAETTVTAGADGHGGTPPAGTGSGGRRIHSDRPVLIAALCFLVFCLGFVLFGVVRDGDEGEAGPEVLTAPVTYEVTGEGTADLSYQGVSEQGTAETVSGARLPWKRTVEVPLGQNPVIRITLGERGGQVRCAVAVRGRHVQSATASGGFGRATCSASLPAPAPESSG
ncbi:hypothetical protein [Streptomyces griseomycini]|uniref:MmpS family membrane protein n=1 Tax=Streptomyces griseomycini TaxID=66895 RepID=A0A7W7PUP5_9ACTN|nr:hypothetical protein [Streptomyces griseomycini]MBB4901629.1 hypothetical protein [Streptomyces griseomycini]GGQ22312.1 hypothetical protein GCM10010266_51920 [Streptomyces griseomycini]GGR44312.1 hypothetical protein GCM10015536_57660 [Streptomyces griseomycini]